MGHGLHGLCLQGQEPASLPLVPVLLPVPCDLPDLLECVQLLHDREQKDMLSDMTLARLLLDTQLLCSSQSEKLFSSGNRANSLVQTFFLHSLALRASQIASI